MEFQVPPLRTALLANIDAKHRLLLSWNDNPNAISGPLGRPVLGGLLTGFHYMPAPRDQIGVLHEWPGRAAAAIMMIDPTTAEFAPTLQPGESAIYGVDGHRAYYTDTLGNSTLTTSTGKTLTLSATPTGTITLVGTVTGGTASFGALTTTSETTGALTATSVATGTLTATGTTTLGGTVQQAASSPTWSLTAAGNLTATGNIALGSTGKTLTFTGAASFGSPITGSVTGTSGGLSGSPSITVTGLTVSGTISVPTSSIAGAAITGNISGSAGGLTGSPSITVASLTVLSGGAIIVPAGSINGGAISGNIAGTAGGLNSIPSINVSAVSANTLTLNGTRTIGSWLHTVIIFPTQTITAGAYALLSSSLTGVQPGDTVLITPGGYPGPFLLVCIPYTNGFYTYVANPTSSSQTCPNITLYVDFIH